MYEQCAGITESEIEESTAVLKSERFNVHVGLHELLRSGHKAIRSSADWNLYWTFAADLCRAKTTASQRLKANICNKNHLKVGRTKQTHIS